jgi:hypothetical protein
MSFTETLAWINTHWLQFLSGCGVLLVYLWQSLPTERRTELEQRFPRAVGFVRMLVALMPAVRDAYMAGKFQVVLGQPKAEVIRASQLPPALHKDATIPPVVTGLLLMLALCGCEWEREQCGHPGAQTCRNDQPFTCGATTPPRWTPVGDEPCSRQGRTCRVDEAGVAFCSQRVDGGAL